MLEAVSTESLDSMDGQLLSSPILIATACFSVTFIREGTLRDDYGITVSVFGAIGDAFYLKILAFKFLSCD